MVHIALSNMMQHTVFGVDQDSSVSMNNSFWTENYKSSSSKLKRFISMSDTANSIFHNGMLLCEPVHDDNTIKDGDLIVPSWILDIIGVQNGSKIFTHSMRMIIVEPDKVSKIKLIYNGYKSYRHWDEFGTTSPFFIPGSWISDWPVGISINALTKLLPVILHSKMLVHESAVVFSVLDVTMLFQVIIYHQGLSFEQEDSSSTSTTNIGSAIDTINTQIIHGEGDGFIAKAVTVIPALETEFKVSLKSSKSLNMFNHNDTISNNDRNDMGISEVINHAVKVSNVDNNHRRNNTESITYSAVIEKSINIESESDFLSAAYERIILISEAVLSMKNQRQKIGFDDQLKMSVDNHKDNINNGHNNVPWDGVHSILICADEGAGKSYLLNKIEKSIITLKDQGQSMITQKDRRDIRVLRLSGADCDYRKGSSPSSSSSDFNNRVSTDLSTLDKEFFNIRYHLQWLIRLFAVDVEVYNDNLFDTNIERGGIRIILLIDDLDSILLSSTGDEESNDNNDKESLSATAGYHLRQLLYAIAVPSNNLIDRIMIIGTTRASPSTLPRAHTGAPEFETVVTLPRPTWKDRKKILKIMIKDCNIAFESLDTIQDTTSNNDIGYDRNLDLYTDENNEKIKENSLKEIVINDRNIEENFIVWVIRIADLTAGFLPGDLASIIRRAKGLYMGQQNVFSDSNSSHSIPAKSAFSWKSMLAVISSLPPKQLQKLDSLVTTGSSAGELLSWDDFCGYEEVKITLKRLLKLSTIHRADNDLVEGDSVRHSASTSSVRTSPVSTTIPDIMTITDRGQKNECTMTLRESLKVSSDKVRGIVLYGPSGCGKSFLARIIAAEANMNFVSVRSTDLLSKYFGQTEASIRNLFKRVRAAAPCVLFFDEFDALAYKRGLVDEGGGGGGSLQTRVLSTFLNELDGIVSQDTGAEGGILVLAACTDLNVLDDALLRPGRLQHHIKLELPSLVNIEAILQGRIDKLKCGDDVSVKVLADILSGLGRNITGADVENVCRRALIARIREESCNNTCNYDKDINISMSNFYEALNECYPPTSLPLIPPPPLVDPSPFVM